MLETETPARSPISGRLVPELDLTFTQDLARSIDETLASAPRTLTRLLSSLRTSRRPATEAHTFREFQARVEAVEKDPLTDPAIRVFAFYDSKILPPGTKHGNARTAPPVSGTSALEVIFEFFCGRQQPGTSGMSTDCTFDEIAQANVCMSLPELNKFVQMMFPTQSFSRHEMSWVMAKAKMEPLTDNWHGDQDGDLKLLNFVEFLASVLRLALIAWGSKGLSGEEAVAEAAKMLLLDDLPAVKQKLMRIARTNGGFGGWVDESMPVEVGAETAVKIKRGKTLEELMLKKEDMLYLQGKLLRQAISDKNITWVPFDGPYISMVLPTISHNAPHRFQVVVQNVSAGPRSVAFQLKSLPFLKTRYLPVKSTTVPAGMDVVFEMAAYVTKPGDYVGDVLITDEKGTMVFSKCPVYLRVLSTNAIGKSSANSQSQQPPMGYEPGTIHHRMNSPLGSPKNSWETSALLEDHRMWGTRGGVDPLSQSSSRALKGLSNRPGGSHTARSATQTSYVTAKDLLMPLTVRSRPHDPGAAPTSPHNRRSIHSISKFNPDGLAPKKTALSEGHSLQTALHVPGTSAFKSRHASRQPHRLAI